jgi:hypothetical protein
MLQSVSEKDVREEIDEKFGQKLIKTKDEKNELAD